MTATLESIALQLRNGQVDDADQALATLPQTPENIAERIFLDGYVKELRYDRHGALESYQQVLDQQPEHFEATFRAALLSDQCGDDEAAIHQHDRSHRVSSR